MPERSRNANGQTGSMRRIEDEPRLPSTPPRPPTAPELSEAYESTTGVMPAYHEGADRAADQQDADAPA